MQKQAKNKRKKTQSARSAFWDGRKQVDPIIRVSYAPINVKPLGGGGRRPGIGGAFELSGEFLFKCPTPGHLWIVKMATKNRKLYCKG